MWLTRVVGAEGHACQNFCIQMQLSILQFHLNLSSKNHRDCWNCFPLLKLCLIVGWCVWDFSAGHPPHQCGHWADDLRHRSRARGSCSAHGAAENPHWPREHAGHSQCKQCGGHRYCTELQTCHSLGWLWYWSEQAKNKLSSSILGIFWWWWAWLVVLKWKTQSSLNKVSPAGPTNTWRRL